MERLFKTYATPALLLFIKIFTVLRTGLDTLIVAGAFNPDTSMINFINAVLYVVLIDAVMTGLWFYAAYGGDSQRARLLKLFAILGAWTLYIGMVVIGWSAHPDAPFLALMGRIAGGFALGYDSYDYIAGPIREGLVKAYARFMARFEKPTVAEVYKGTVDAALIQAIKKGRSEINKLVYERMALELPDVVSGLLPLPGDITGNQNDTTGEYQTPEQEITSEKIREAWEMCREQFKAHEEFRRSDIEECTTLGRSRAGTVLNYAIRIGDVIRVGHGVYKYTPTPTIVVDPPQGSDF